jgi:hypothetical protein
MNAKILLNAILNRDFETYSNLLESELTPEQYNYNMNEKEMNDEISSRGMDTYLNYRSTLFSLVAHMKYYEKDSSYYDTLIKHHQKFNNINVYSTWRDENLLFSNTFQLFIEDFIKLGMNSKMRNKNGDTPVMYAIRTNLLELLDTLLNAGADYKSRDKNGAGILMFAALNNEKALEVLLNYEKLNNLKELKKLKEKGLYYPEIKLLLEEKIQMKLEKTKFEFLLSNKKENLNKTKRKL